MFIICISAVLYAPFDMSGRGGGCQTRFLIRVGLDCINGLNAMNSTVYPKLVVEIQFLTWIALIYSSGTRIYMTQGVGGWGGGILKSELALYQWKDASLCNPSIFYTRAFISGKCIYKKIIYGVKFHSV